MDLNAKSYTPGNLFDRISERVGAMNDAQLSRKIGIDAAALSSMRGRKKIIGPTMLVRLNDLTNISIGELREMMGLPRRMYITR